MGKSFGRRRSGRKSGGCDEMREISFPLLPMNSSLVDTVFSSDDLCDDLLSCERGGGGDGVVTGVQGRSRARMERCVVSSAEVCEERCLASGVMASAMERFEAWKRGESLVDENQWMSESVSWQNGSVSGVKVLPESRGSSGVDLSVDQGVMVTAEYSSVSLRDAKSGEVLWRKNAINQSNRMFQVSFSPDAQYIAIGCDRGSVEVVRTETGESVWRVEGGRNDQLWENVMWSGDGTLVICQRQEGTPVFFDRMDGTKRVFAQTAQNMTVLGGEMVLSQGNRVRMMSVEGVVSQDAAFDPSFKTGKMRASQESGLVSVIEERRRQEVNVMNMRTGKPIGGEYCANCVICDAAVSPAGTVLVFVTSRDELIMKTIYRGAVAEEILRMRMPGGLGDLKFSRDGSMVYGIGREGVMSVVLPARSRHKAGTEIPVDPFRWGTEPTNVYRVLQERTSSSNLSSRGSTNSFSAAVGLAPASQRSDTYRYYTMGGSPQAIFEVCYVNSEGVWTVPREFYEMVGENGVVVFPGCPKNVVLKSYMKNGARNGNFEIQLKRETPVKNDILPINRVQFRGMTVNTLQDGDRGEGFGGVISEAPSYSRALLENGRTVTIQMNLWNEGMVGGVREIAIAVGYETDGSNPITKRFSRNFGALEGVSLQFSVTDPRDPKAHLFPHRRPLVTVWSIDPVTGQKEIIHEIAGRVTEYRVNERDRTAFLQNLAREQSALPMYAADGKTIIGQGGRVIAEESSTEGKGAGVTIVPSSPTAAIENVLDDTRLLIASVDDRNVKLMQGLQNRTVEMGVIDGKKLLSRLERVPLSPESSTSVRFTLTEPMMMNAMMEGKNLGVITGLATTTTPNIDLRLYGSSSSDPLLTSSHRSALPLPLGERFITEMMSQLLQPGTYTLQVSDMTKYEGLQRALFAKNIYLPAIPLSLQFAPMTGSIEGRMMNEAGTRVMPVRLHRAGFDSEGNRVAPESLPALDPSKPLWVVVHGMNSREDFDTIQSLTQELTLNSSITQQVMTVDWREASQAKVGGDAPWTPIVGEFIAKQLEALGFTPDKIHFVGHSHGTYVSYAAAYAMMQGSGGKKVNAIVALDPAGNFPPFSQFDASHINFGKVAERSVAIEASLISGSNVLAETADVAFQVESPQTNSVIFWNEHSLPISTFTNLLRNNRIAQGDIPEYLQLDVISGIRKPSNILQKNVYKDTYEGIITVSVKAMKSVVTGETYYDAMPNLVEYQDDTGSWKKRLLPNDATIISS